MIRLSVLVGFLLIRASFAVGDDTNKLPGTISVEVTMVAGDSSKLGDQDSPGETLARVRQLEKAGGGLQSLGRMRFSVVENTSCSVQFGEQIPVVSGQSAGYTRSGGPSRTITSVRTERVGTLLQCQARIQDGVIVMELNGEQSKIRKLKQPEGSDMPALSVVDSMTVESTLHIADGETVIAGGQTKTTTDGSTTTLMLVTAKISRPAKLTPPTHLSVFTLANLNAKEAIRILSQILDGDGAIRIAPHEDSNAVVVAGTRDQLKTIEALLLRLDRAK